MSGVRTGPQKQTVSFSSVWNAYKNPTVLTFFIPISHMHYTFLYALYMITGVRKLNEHLHDAPEKQATWVTPIAPLHIAGLPQPRYMDTRRVIQKGWEVTDHWIEALTSRRDIKPDISYFLNGNQNSPCSHLFLQMLKVPEALE